VRRRCIVSVAVLKESASKPIALCLHRDGMHDSNTAEGDGGTLQPHDRQEDVKTLGALGQNKSLLRIHFRKAPPFSTRT
jgi:hypothetical protein